MPRVSLGLIMILRDEQANLGRSLVPVAHCFDEVVVADTGSQDGTAEMCRRLGARVHDFAWRDDFAAARNFSIEQAKTDWLFWLDGDNAITPDMVKELRELLPQQPAVLWALERLEGKGGMLWQKRCFPRSPRVHFAGRVHEQLMHPPQWPSLATPLVVRHWGYADHGRAQNKGRYYLRLIEQMLEDNPDDFYARYQMGRTLFNLREFSSAIEHLSMLILDRAAQARNRQIWAHGHFLLAQAWERLAKPDLAGEVLQEFLRQAPEEGLGHYHCGRLAYGQEDWAAAAQHLAKALDLGLEAPFVELDPGKTLFLAEYFLGRSHERLGSPQKAMVFLERAARRQPENPAPLTDLARLLLGQGQAAKARSHLEHVLEHHPGDRQALRLLARLEQAA